MNVAPTFENVPVDSRFVSAELIYMLIKYARPVDRVAVLIALVSR